VVSELEKKSTLMIRPSPVKTLTLQPAPSDIVTIHPTNVYILIQSNPTGVGMSDHLQTAQFDPLEVGLNVGCDNLTHSLLRWGEGGQFGPRHTDGAVKKNSAAPPKRTSPTHGSAGRKPDLT
jgi:hypothetical protein